MDVRLKGTDSQEGAGLSVSLDPEAWTKIAQLGGNPTYRLRHDGGRFLDFQSARSDKQEVAKVVSWAIEHEYIASTSVYRLWQYDSEEEHEYYMEFTSLADLLGEVGGEPSGTLASARSLAREEGKRITQAKGWQVLPAALVRARHSRADSIFGLDFAFLFYTEDETDLDGVWWRYSEGPDRGCIFEGKLAYWHQEMIEGPHWREEILA
jgi:hypothetical protein